MRASGIVEVEPFADDTLGVEAVGHLDEVDGFVFQGPPQALQQQKGDLSNSEMAA